MCHLRNHSLGLITKTPGDGREEQWFAVSADHRSHYEPEQNYRSYCKFVEMNFCEITTPQTDLSQDWCLSGFFFGKIEKALKLCEKIILPQNFNPLFRRIVTRINTWVYSVDQTYHLELKCRNGCREISDLTKNRLGKTMWQLWCDSWRYDPLQHRDGWTPSTRRERRRYVH